jgi:riboflavin kinase/FMN adenylyltransferase
MLPATITGEITRFKGDGRKLGYPTANLAVETDLKDGVYFGHADLAEFRNHPALIFIGTPTTIGEVRRRVEVHLLDIPDKDYYGEQLKTILEHYHRENQTFESVEKLLEVMKNDEMQAREWFSSGSTRT